MLTVFEVANNCGGSEVIIRKLQGFTKHFLSSDAWNLIFHIWCFTIQYVVFYSYFSRQIFRTYFLYPTVWSKKMYNVRYVSVSKNKIIIQKRFLISGILKFIFIFVLKYRNISSRDMFFNLICLHLCLPFNSDTRDFTAIGLDIRNSKRMIYHSISNKCTKNKYILKYIFKNECIPNLLYPPRSVLDFW